MGKPDQERWRRVDARPAAQANLDLLAGRIADLVRESEKLGEEGDVDGSQAAAQQADTLKVPPPQRCLLSVLCGWQRTCLIEVDVDRPRRRRDALEMARAARERRVQWHVLLQT